MIRGGGGGGAVDAGSNHTYLALYTLDMQNNNAGSPKTLSQWEYRNKIFYMIHSEMIQKKRCNKTITLLGYNVVLITGVPPALCLEVS